MTDTERPKIVIEIEQNVADLHITLHACWLSEDFLLAEIVTSSLSIDG